MIFDIDRHPLVWKDIDSIAFLIGDYAGFDIAERKTYEIERTIQQLRQYPHIGSPRDDVVEDLRVIPSAEKAVICFTVDNNAGVVRIICVTYAGQDWQRTARNRK